MARSILLAVLGAFLVASTVPLDAAYQARPLPLSTQRVQPLPLPSLSSGASRVGPIPVRPAHSRTGQPSVPQAPGISPTPENRLRGSQQGIQESHQAPFLHTSQDDGTMSQPPEERPEAVRVTEVKVVEEKKQHPPAPGATLLSADKAAEISLDETLKQQQKTREELEKLQRDDQSGVQEQKGPLNDAQQKWQEAVENEARDSGSHQEAEASLALKELIRKSAEQERQSVLAGAGAQATPAPVQTPEPQTQSSLNQRSPPSDDSDDVCKGLEVTTTKMSSAPLAILYYFNPDSVIHFHSLSLILPDGKTFLSDVRAVVRDAPPTDENPFPKSVAHLSGGYKLTLSLEGVKLEDHEGSEIASWEAETVLHPIILEEVSIRDAAAIAPASSGLAAVSSAAVTSAIPGGIPDSSLLQQGAAGGASPLDNTQGGPEAIVGGGRAMKSVRVLPVSRGNVGSVRITTTNEMAPTMGAFTCVFRTGVFSDYDPCSSPSFISPNFFTPLVAMIVGGF